jgi:GT2 family glycosyltransferase/regulator of replication initiation timing
MVVSIIGMHRSGTSMIAKLLNQCGVYLGEEKEMVPATPDNPEGHWEHTGFVNLNDELLGLWGGGWDRPPSFLADWPNHPTCIRARAKARTLLAKFDGRPAWGWKDPRGTLTFPFWNDLQPDLKVVVCLRNPLEVARSLNRRRLCSYALGLDLWNIYTQCILTTTRPEQRIVTHYAAYFDNPGDELRRVLDFVGLQVSAEALCESLTAAKANLRHHQFTRRHLNEAGLSEEIREAYQRLCDESGYDDGDPEFADSSAPMNSAKVPTPFDFNGVEAEILRRDKQFLHEQVAQRDVTVLELRNRLNLAISEHRESTEGCERLRQALDAEKQNVSDCQTMLRARDESILELERQCGEYQQRVNEYQRQIGENEQHIGDLLEKDRRLQLESEALTAALDLQNRAAAGAQALVEEKEALLADLRRDLERWKDQVLKLTQRQEAESPHRVAYRGTVESIRELVRDHVPADAIVVVISKGDEELLERAGSRGWHFPQNETGGYAGYYPANGRNAIVHLEVLRARGARYLVLPAPYAWWLDSYPDVKHHLERRYRVLAQREGAGVLYLLAGSESNGADLAESAFATVVERFRRAFGRMPSVLDWSAGRRLADHFPDLPVFAPPAANGRLPYVDRSVDVVAIESTSTEAFAEAKRVAETCVVNFAGGEPQGTRAEPCWLRELPASVLPTVSIVIPVFNQWAHTAACLAALNETLSGGFHGEIIVVDDGSTHDTQANLERLAAADNRLRLLVNPVNQGFVDSCNRGARAATGEFLVFLNNDTVPLAGWLPPLLRTFEQFPDAGAVGGKLLFPDGRLQEAGGIIFRDASAAHFGRGDADTARLLFNYVREVDYCSGALLATRRSLFLELGGFAADFSPGYYEDVDYCFRLRERGRPVYYQPESEVAHMEGASSADQSAGGMKRHQDINLHRFQERWAAVLRQQPERPIQFDLEAWCALATSKSAERVQR